MIYHLTMLSVLLVTITSGSRPIRRARKRGKSSRIQTGTCRTVEETLGEEVVLLNQKKDNYTITCTRGVEDITVTSNIHAATIQHVPVSPKAKTDKKHSQFHLKIYHHHRNEDAQNKLVTEFKEMEKLFKRKPSKKKPSKKKSSKGQNAGNKKAQTEQSYLYFNIPYKYVKDVSKPLEMRRCLPKCLADQFPETTLIKAIKSNQTLKIRLKMHKGCSIKTTKLKLTQEKIQQIKKDKGIDVGCPRQLVTVTTISFRVISPKVAKKKLETPMPVETLLQDDDLRDPNGDDLSSLSGSNAGSPTGPPKSPPSPPKSPPKSPRSPPKSPPSPPKSPPKSPRSPPKSPLKSFTLPPISVVPDEHRRRSGDMSSTTKILGQIGYGYYTPKPMSPDSDDEWDSDNKALAPNANPPIYKPQSPKVRAVSPPPLPIVESVTEPAEPKNETVQIPEPARKAKTFTTKRTCNPQEGPQYNDWTSDGLNQTAFFHANFSPDLRHLLSSIVHNKSAGNKAYQRHAGCARKSRAARKAARSIERTQDNRQHDENKFIPNRTLANGGQLIRRLSNDPRYDCSDGSVLTKDGYEALVLDSKKKGKSNSKGKDVFGPRFERKKRKVIRSMDLSNHGSAI